MSRITWYTRLQRHAKWGWMVLLLFVGLLCLLGFDRRADYFGEQNKALDNRYEGYTRQEVHDLFHNIGPNGREVYMVTALTLDVLFPLTFGLLMVFIVVRNYPAKVGRWLLLLPILVVLFDLLENFTIAHLAWHYKPDELAPLADVASFFTMTKWVLAAVAVTVLVIGIIGRRGGWINPKK